MCDDDSLLVAITSRTGSLWSNAAAAAFDRREGRRSILNERERMMEERVVKWIRRDAFACLAENEQAAFVVISIKA
jgi:hypothetical protein